jgi:hypothetical protein
MDQRLDAARAESRLEEPGCGSGVTGRVAWSWTNVSMQLERSRGWKNRAAAPA